MDKKPAQLRQDNAGGFLRGQEEVAAPRYQVDERDGDIASFFYYMGFAARRAAPRKRKPMSALTPEYLPGLRVFAMNYFEELFGRLRQPFLLVFDNYHELPAESPFHDVIAMGLEFLPREGAALILSKLGERERDRLLKSVFLPKLKAAQLAELTGDRGYEI